VGGTFVLPFLSIFDKARSPHLLNIHAHTLTNMDYTLYWYRYV